MLKEDRLSGQYQRLKDIEKGDFGQFRHWFAQTDYKPVGSIQRYRGHVMSNRNSNGPEEALWQLKQACAPHWISSFNLTGQSKTRNTSEREQQTDIRRKIFVSIMQLVLYIILGVVLLLTVILFIQIRKRFHCSRIMNRNLSIFTEAAPDATNYFDSNGVITLANRQAGKIVWLHGWGVTGLNVEVLITKKRVNFMWENASNF